MKKILVIGIFVLCMLNGQAQDTLVMPLTGNGGVFNLCYGVIYDNGIDSNYTNDIHSTITIAPLWVQNVSLYFEEFDTEIFFDSLSIYDGPATTFPLIGTYSGTSLQGQTISSTGTAITLAFRSDDIQTGTGFKAWINCLLATEILNKTSIQLYPNPAQSHLFVEGADWQEIERVYMVDIMGRMIQLADKVFPISVEELKAGLYGLCIIFKNGESTYLKWLKE
jgi:CUB domain/Secretion system C-terminal sorting domain